jgi:hypothetical protein
VSTFTVICTVLVLIFLVHDRRTVAEHRAAAARYLLLTTEAARKDFLKTKATSTAPAGYRPTCLVRLPYWDGARMIVVDPMHNLFLGKFNPSNGFPILTQSIVRHRYCKMADQEYMA